MSRVVQPMYWSFPERGEAYAVPNQYFFGFELVVCPIVTPRDRRTGLAGVKAWLPPLHRHVDIFTGTVYDGDRELVLYRPLSEYPVLAHEGSVVPLDASLAPANGGKNPDAFEVLVVVGRNGGCSVMEDPDDDSDEVKKQAPSSGERGSLLQYNQKEGKFTANVTGRTWAFRFLAITTVPEGLKVEVNDQDVTDDCKVTTHVYPETPSLLISCPQHTTEDKYTITISLGADPQLSIIDHRPRIKQMLLEYQTDFALKDRIWSVVDDGSKSAVGVKVGKLMSLGVDEALVGAVMELLVAESRA